MKNLSLLLCSLLLNGVFGDTDEVKVSVKEGDSVTLKIKPEDINGASTLVWKKMNDKPDIIGILTVKLKHSEVFDTSDNIFGDRLKLNNQTGSLTITNMRSQHSGLYQMEIRGNKEKIKTFRVSVSGVFGDTEDNVSVKEGDSVTLTIHPKVENETEGLVWRFKGVNIANIDLEVKDTPPVYTDERFRDRLNLERQTGSLTITNIRSKDSGEYKLEIKSKEKSKYKTFRVSVSGQQNMSVMEGEYVTLQTEATRIQIEDVIEWKFKDSLIVYSNKTTSTGRFDMDSVGSLLIKNIKSEDSGLYDVNITGSKIIHKRFKVTVTERGLSTGQVTGIICGVLLVIAVVGVIVYRRIKYEQQKQKVKEMTVPEGHSVTLESDVTELQSDDVIEWIFRDKVIVIFSMNNKLFTDEQRLRDRLQVDDQTGSLIITNIRTEDAGLYKLKISSSSRLKSFLQFITGGGPSYYQFNVFVRERIKPVMLEGFVTLETGVTEVQTNDKIQWTFENDKTLIAEMTVGTKPSYDSTAERFRNRLRMDPQTGDLVILDITTELSGVYKAQIISNSRGRKERDYRVAISVITYRGESVTLNTESKIHRNSEIKWISDDETILETVKNGDKREIKYTDERFKDRLEMNPETGDLTIKDIRQTDYGLYILQEINSDRKISCGIFSVLVRDGHSPNQIKQNSAGTEGNETATVEMALLNEPEDRF